MGARQSGQSETAGPIVPNNEQDCRPADVHAAVAGEATSSTSNSSGARTRVSANGQSVSSRHHHHRRPHHQHRNHNQPRQSRSRSINTEHPQIDDDAAAIIAALRQQQRRRNEQVLNAATGDASDQSTDSGDELTNNTIRSLDRLLRLNSDTYGSSSSRVWVPPVSFRCLVMDTKCPICNKSIPVDDVDYHLVICLTRPRIDYNEEVLQEDRGECVICFDEMSQGDTIARLPCLCVYHKICIDGWFKVKNCCPAHPGDD